MTQISATVQVISFFIILIVILIAYKYYVYTFEETVSKPVSIQKAEPIVNKVRCPPVYNKLNVNSLEHKNNLNHPNAQIKLYQEGDDVSAEGFQKSVITPAHQQFTSELEEVYIQSVATEQVVNTIPYIKPNKSDLPIANVPYFLLQEDRPLRLSEKLT